MSHFDDLPERNATHETDDSAQLAFTNALRKDLFQIQSVDRKDYGCDIQLEVLDGKSVTNLRTQVQLKGTAKAARSDSTITIGVARSNLNYLLGNQDSLYICFHLPSSKLYAQSVIDVLAKYEHSGSDWTAQGEISIRFAELFDDAFQQRLHARVLARGKAERDIRAKWASARPDDKAKLVNESVPHIEIPLDPIAAGNLLNQLYEAGHDDVLSFYLDQFNASLIAHPLLLMPALFAEINRAMNGKSFKEERLMQAIELLRRRLSEESMVEPSSTWYCIGNAYSGLGKLAEAREAYLTALGLLDSRPSDDLEAQCCKNFGSVLEKQGNESAARVHYERALCLDPMLSEAHMAMASWYRRNSPDPAAELKHLDQVDIHRRSAVPTHAVVSWRLDAQFRLGDFVAAFRDIQSLLSDSTRFDWIWPWCANRVAKFGKSDVDAAALALRFWKLYLRARPEDVAAMAELVQCAYMRKMAGVPVDVTYTEFWQLTHGLVGQDAIETARLWDRAGHWAQHDSDWENAEEAFRKAYDLDAAKYAYCLCVALNNLGRYQEVVAVCSQEDVRPEMDSLMWFQLGVAQSNIDDFAGAIESYWRSIDMDEEYANAWFNLGGAYWNDEQIYEAALVWREAVSKFPDDALAATVKTEFSMIFDILPDVDETQ